MVGEKSDMYKNAIDIDVKKENYTSLNKNNNISISSSEERTPLSGNARSVYLLNAILNTIALLFDICKKSPKFFMLLISLLYGKYKPNFIYTYCLIASIIKTLAGERKRKSPSFDEECQSSNQLPEHTENTNQDQSLSVSLRRHEGSVNATHQMVEGTHMHDEVDISENVGHQAAGHQHLNQPHQEKLGNGLNQPPQGQEQAHDLDPSLQEAEHDQENNPPPQDVEHVQDNNPPFQDEEHEQQHLNQHHQVEVVGHDMNLPHQQEELRNEIIPVLQDEEFGHEINQQQEQEQQHPQEPSNVIRALRTEQECLKRKLTCTNCNEKESNVVFLPCGHFVMCNICSFSCNVCPVCTKPVLAETMVYLS